MGKEGDERRERREREREEGEERYELLGFLSNQSLCPSPRLSQRGCQVRLHCMPAKTSQVPQFSRLLKLEPRTLQVHISGNHTSTLSL